MKAVKSSVGVIATITLLAAVLLSAAASQAKAQSTVISNVGGTVDWNGYVNNGIDYDVINWGFTINSDQEFDVYTTTGVLWASFYTSTDSLIQTSEIHITAVQTNWTDGYTVFDGSVGPIPGRSS